MILVAHVQSDIMFSFFSLIFFHLESFFGQWIWCLLDHIPLRNDDETCRCSIWILQSITLWTCVLSGEGSRPWNLLDCHCEQRPASSILDCQIFFHVNECECEITSTNHWQISCMTRIYWICWDPGCLRKNIEKMELQCDFLHASGSNWSAPCSASMPPWKPLMKTSQWLRRWDAWHKCCTAILTFCVARGIPLISRIGKLGLSLSDTNECTSLQEKEFCMKA